jgi:hypothetical protein
MVWARGGALVCVCGGVGDRRVDEWNAWTAAFEQAAGAAPMVGLPAAKAGRGPCGCGAAGQSAAVHKASLGHGPAPTSAERPRCFKEQMMR